MTKWVGVPKDRQSAWQTAFSQPSSGVRLAARCPVFRAAELCRFYGTMDKRGNAGLWEWCAACHTYEHSNSKLPSWWTPISLLNEASLTAEPGSVEVQLAFLDSRSR
jgi:hypothetical protein